MSVSVRLAKPLASPPLLSLNALRREVMAYAARASVPRQAVDESFTCDDVALCTYELALNALLYALEPHSVTLDVVGTEMRVTVSDGSVAPVPLGDESAPDDDSDRGRGLRLVSALSDAQELRLERQGKKVRACWALSAPVVMEPVTFGVAASLSPERIHELRARGSA